MTVLLDTSVVVDYLRGRETVVAELRSREWEVFNISAATLAELHEGIAHARDPGAMERTIRDFLRGGDVLPVDESVAREFGRLRFTFAGADSLSGTWTF